MAWKLVEKAIKIVLYIFMTDKLEGKDRLPA